MAQCLIVARTDEGQWILFHPDEVSVTLLIQLPDPLPLNDGMSLPLLRPVDQVSRAKLTGHEDKMVAERLDAPSDPVDCRQIFAPSNNEPRAPVVLFNKHHLGAFVRVHQTTDGTRLRAGLDPAAAIAVRLARASHVPADRSQRSRLLLWISEFAGRWSLGRLDAGSANERGREPDATARRGLFRRGRRRQSALEIAGREIENLGLIRATVLEIRVGVRILGPLPSLPPILTGAARARPDGTQLNESSPGDPALWDWHLAGEDADVDVAVLARRVRHALELSVTQIRSLQQEIHALRRLPIVLSTVERLPPLVPVLIHSNPAAEPKGPHVSMLATRPQVDPVAGAALTDHEFEHWGYARRRTDRGPFSAYVDVRREAHVALTRLGDYRLAALLCGVAAESLLDELLLHLTWEEARTPEQAANDWRAGLESRVRSEFAGRIGGSWDVTRGNPIGRWAQHLAALRHRVAHAAYTPSRDEAERSFMVLDELTSHLCDLLAAPSTLRRYPRTAVTLAGTDGLQRRSAYTNRVRDLMGSSEEVPWIETYSRWREAWRRLRQDITGAPRVPDPATSYLLAVLRESGGKSWCLHDRQNHLAVELPPEIAEASVSDVARVSLAQIEAIVRDGQPRDWPLSIAIDRAGPVSLPPDATWVEEYHLVPMTQVMVDQTDYQQRQP
jgi:hypothetical protein